MLMRKGKIYATQEFVESEDAGEVFSILGFVPYHVEFLYERMRFEMSGKSHLFDRLGEGMMSPEYKIILTRDDDDILSVSVERQD